MIRTLVLITASIASASLNAQVDHSRSRIPTVTACELLRNPLLYDGHVLRIRDRIVATDEGAWFKGEECPGVVVTGNFVWDPLISLDAPGLPLQIHPVDFEYDVESEQNMRIRYKKLRARAPDECIVFTYTGMFETRREWSKMLNGNPRGFGHLNRAPAHLVVKSADDVEVVSPCISKRGAKR